MRFSMKKLGKLTVNFTIELTMKTKEGRGGIVLLVL